MSDVAPAVEQVQPPVPMLGEALELAELVKPSWSDLRKQTGPLVCEGEEEATTGTTETAPPDTSDTETGSEESGEFPDFDLSKVPDELRPDAERYAQEVKKHFQGDYTRKTQTLAEERREAEQATQVINALRNPNPHIRAATLAQLGIDERTALEIFGYQPGEEQDDLDGLDDLDEVRDPRVDKLIQEREAEKAEAKLEEDFAAQVEALEGTEKRELTPKEQKTLWRNVRAELATNGTANVQEIWAEMKDLYSDYGKTLLDPKRNAPRPPGNGGPGSKAADLTNPEVRRRVMAEAADRQRASSA